MEALKALEARMSSNINWLLSITGELRILKGTDGYISGNPWVLVSVLYDKGIVKDYHKDSDTILVELTDEQFLHVLRVGVDSVRYMRSGLTAVNLEDYLHKIAPLNLGVISVMNEFWDRRVNFE